MPPDERQPAVASIIVCTYNRADSLKGTLDSLKECDVHGLGNIEWIVVDNASTDHTKQVVEAYSGDEFAVKYVYEPRQGLSHARNAGIDSSTGNLIIFTDDDVRPTKDWAAQHVRAYDNPEVAAVQGRIELQYEETPPAWLGSMHKLMLAERVPDDKPILPYTTRLTGANMSFRRTVRDKIGPFNTLLGPGNAGFHDDTEFSQRILDNGFTQLYQPAAKVQHIIPPDRLTCDYYKNYAFRLGIGTYMAGEVGSFPRVPNPYSALIKASLREVKWRLVARLRGQQYDCTEGDLFYRMHVGTTWAYFKGIKELTRRYST